VSFIKSLVEIGANGALYRCDDKLIATGDSIVLVVNDKGDDAHFICAEKRLRNGGWKPIKVRSDTDIGLIPSRPLSDLEARRGPLLRPEDIAPMAHGGSFMHINHYAVKPILDWLRAAIKLNLNMVQVDFVPHNIELRGDGIKTDFIRSRNPIIVKRTFMNIDPKLLELGLRSITMTGGRPKDATIEWESSGGIIFAGDRILIESRNVTYRTERAKCYITVK